MPAFFADVMLGRLARWLRILGYDTAYERAVSDAVLVERALEENRWVLTRDGYLAKRRALRGRHTLVASDRLDDQLRQLRVELHLELTAEAETASRCPECNLVLEELPREEAVRKVPPFVADHHAEFALCAGCGRVYWPGSHWVRLCARLERLKAS